MKITFLCSDQNHPVNEYLSRWILANKNKHEISLVRSKADLTGGDILFLLSCSEIIDSSERACYAASLVLHASDLPKGRGWSPHIWQICEGSELIALSLIEAEDLVDSGRLWHQTNLCIPRHALWNEINDILFLAEMRLIDFAVQKFGLFTPVSQCKDVEPTYYPKRKPSDSKLDPNKTIAEQFNLMRVCDPDRYPAYFEMHGHKYKLILKKFEEGA